jgi:hypothetical protein
VIDLRAWLMRLPVWARILAFILIAVAAHLFAHGMHRQHPSILLTEPELLGVYSAEPGGWRYMRVKFRIWPGQGELIERTFK